MKLYGRQPVEPLLPCKANPRALTRLGVELVQGC
jgi:hypothetical protein